MYLQLERCIHKVLKWIWYEKKTPPYQWVKQFGRTPFWMVMLQNCLCCMHNVEELYPTARTRRKCYKQKSDCLSLLEKNLLESQTKHMFIYHFLPSPLHCFQLILQILRKIFEESSLIQEKKNSTKTQQQVALAWRSYKFWSHEGLLYVAEFGPTASTWLYKKLSTEKVWLKNIKALFSEVSSHIFCLCEVI